jgi:hypothetical protein
VRRRDGGLAGRVRSRVAVHGRAGRVDEPLQRHATCCLQQSLGDADVRQHVVAEAGVPRRADAGLCGEVEDDVDSVQQGLQRGGREVLLQQPVAVVLECRVTFARFCDSS